jgi:hypothetical protein
VIISASLCMYAVSGDLHVHVYGIYEKSVCVQLLAIVSKSTKLQTCTVDLSGITAKGHLNLKN